MEDGRRVTKRISFSLEEDRIVREKAKEAGMSITAYIRQQALEGQVVSVDWEMIRQHTEAINRIAFDMPRQRQVWDGNPWGTSPCRTARRRPSRFRHPRTLRGRCGRWDHRSRRPGGRRSRPLPVRREP